MLCLVQAAPETGPTLDPFEEYVAVRSLKAPTVLREAGMVDSLARPSFTMQARVTRKETLAAKSVADMCIEHLALRRLGQSAQRRGTILHSLARIHGCPRDNYSCRVYVHLLSPFFETSKQSKRCAHRHKLHHQNQLPVGEPMPRESAAYAVPMATWNLSRASRAPCVRGLSRTMIGISFRCA